MGMSWVEKVEKHNKFKRVLKSVPLVSENWGKDKTDSKGEKRMTDPVPEQSEPEMHDAAETKHSKRGFRSILQIKLGRIGQNCRGNKRAVKDRAEWIRLIRL